MLSRDFFRFWLGQFLAIVGGRCCFLGLSWWTLASTGSKSHFTQLAIVYSVVGFISLPLLAPLADRWPRKWCALAADLVTADLSLTRVLAALSDPLRLDIVCLLSDGQERQWGELDAPVAKSTLNHHITTLRNAGITRTRADGIRCYVHLRADDLETRFPGLLAALLKTAPQHVDSTPVGFK